MLKSMIIGNGAVRRRTDMERLTERLENGVINVKYASQHETAIHRLAAIEDILGDEYDLDELREMAQAKRGGRCVVLPCKVEDDVYINILGRTLPFTVISISQMSSTPTFKAQHGIRLVYIFKADDVGETVFMTRAEAEAALRREQDG